MLALLDAVGTTPALFLDYDGTLTPIVDEPSNAILSSAMRERLERLAARGPVAIISGRDRDDVRDRVGLRQLAYAGSHGYDIIGPFERFEHRVGEERREALLELGRELERSLSAISGVRVEQKRFSIAVHFRGLPDAALPELQALLRRAIERPQFALVEGKKVLDIRPYADWHKGQSVRWLIGALGAAARRPVYIGDDATDELAFETLTEAVTVRVGPEPTKAHHRLHDVDEVGRFLDTLIDQIVTV